MPFKPVRTIKIHDPPADNPDAGEPIPVTLAMPSLLVVSARPGEILGRRQISAHPGLELLLEFLDASGVQNVFQARQLPVRPVAEIAMDGHSRLGYV